MSKYCTHCGNEVNENAVICVKCGCAIKPDNANNTSQVYSPGVVAKLSQRLTTNAVIWLVIAGLQILAGLAINWFLLIVGALNLASGIGCIKFSKKISTQPTGIIKEFKPLTGPIITLIYNLIFGGIIGIIGSIYYLIAIRGFVVENENEFVRIESECQ